MDMESFKVKRMEITRTEGRRSRTGTTAPIAIVVVVVVAVLLAWVISVAYGQSPLDVTTEQPWLQNDAIPFYVLGDSSVDCGDNTLFYSLLHHNLSLYPCNGSDASLLPNLLAEKMGLPHTQPFYRQNGSFEGLISSVNFGSAEAMIMNPGSQSYQSLNQQLRQVFELFQLLQLQVSQDYADQLIKSSIFYLSFGKDDYINLFLRNASGIMTKYSSQEFAHMLVSQMSHVMSNLYDVNVRKIIFMGILPLGCTPRTVWEWHNSSSRAGGYSDEIGPLCMEGINELIVEYNTMLEEHILELNTKLPGAQLVFCDVYQGIMEIVTNPKHYGFEDAQSACCGLGWRGGMIGCLSVDMACNQSSTHVWWDFYNPTFAVNSLLADSAWSGQPIRNMCRPGTLHQLVSTTASSTSLA